MSIYAKRAALESLPGQPFLHPKVKMKIQRKYGTVAYS